jgi:hypothetical protein
MQSSSPLQSQSSTASANAEVSRQLNDEVLQSAEEAVLVAAAAPDGGVFPTAPSSPARSPDIHAPAPHPARSSYSSYQTAVRQYVAANPCQSALMAAAAGALAALLLRSRLRMRAGSRGWTRMR